MAPAITACICEGTMGAMKENPRYNMLSLRISDAEYNEVFEMAKQWDISLSEAARMMMFRNRLEVRE